MIQAFVAAGVVAVFGLGAAAEPPRWVSVERDARGVPVYYDANSVSRPPGAGDTVTVTVKASFAEAEGPVEGMEKYSYCLKEVEINCPREEYRVTETALYDRGGNLSSTSCPYPRSWEGVGGSIVMRKLHESLCGKGRIRTMPGGK